MGGNEQSGWVTLSRQTVGEVLEALRRSVPRSRDAVRLFELVEERLGDRAVRDWYHAPSERCLLLRDPEHPGWLLPHRLLYLDEEVAPEPPMEWPTLPEWLRSPSPPREVVDTAGPILLNPGGKAARLEIHEGPSAVTFAYGPKGALSSITVNAGEHYAYSSREEDRPFRIDPAPRSPLRPPVSLVLRDDWRPEGHLLEELAARVAELRPEARDLGRVHTPRDEPGNAMGAWFRGLRALREAAWSERLADDAAGWAVIDAWNGTALALGDTLASAFAAWKEEVARVQPLPPVARPASPPEEPAEPRAPEVVVDDEARTVTTSAEVVIRLEPPVLVDWAEPRPEHTPAVAIPVRPAPAVPAALAAAGFTRALRLYAEHGEEGFTFVRRDEGGFTLVGDVAAGAVDALTLDAALEAEVARQRAELAELLARFDPPDAGRECLVEVVHFQVRSAATGAPRLLATSSTRTTSFDVRGLDLGVRHAVVRVRSGRPGADPGTGLREGG